MVRILRTSVLILASATALLITFKVWGSVRTPSTLLKIHVSTLAFGYSLLLGIAIQDVIRAISDRDGPDLALLTWLRLISVATASTGYVLGFAWVHASGRTEALLRPVLLTDILVIALAWIVTFRGFNRRPNLYRDLIVGLGVLLTWYVATIK